MTFLSTKTWAEKVAQTNTGEAARRLKTHTEETGIEAESPGAWWNTLRCQQPSALFTLNHFCGSHKITASIGCFCLMHPHKYFHHWKSFPAVESFSCRWVRRQFRCLRCQVGTRQSCFPSARAQLHSGQKWMFQQGPFTHPRQEQ